MSSLSKGSSSSECGVGGIVLNLCALKIFLSKALLLKEEPLLLKELRLKAAAFAFAFDGMLVGQPALILLRTYAGVR